jgi:acto-N-neotetraose biosynthesis glycosyltransferase lgtB
MDIYVISLTNANARREYIKQIFGDKNIPFHFFNALRPSKVLDDAIDQLVPSLKHQSFLSEVEKACFMSHVVLWQRVLDMNLPYVAVFEDDVLLGRDAEKFLTEDDWLNERITMDSAFIVRLETLLIPVNIKSSNIPTYQNRQFPLLDSPQGGAAGYIISRAAIRFILNDLYNLSAEQIQPIDLMMFGEYLSHKDIVVYQVSPGICVQELNFSQQQHKDSWLGSQIESQRRQNQIEYRRKYKKRRSLKERLQRALTKFSREKKKRAQVIIPFM